MSTIVQQEKTTQELSLFNILSELKKKKLYGKKSFDFDPLVLTVEIQNSLNAILALLANKQYFECMKAITQLVTELKNLPIVGPDVAIKDATDTNSLNTDPKDISDILFAGLSSCGMNVAIFKQLGAIQGVLSGEGIFDCGQNERTCVGDFMLASEAVICKKFSDETYKDKVVSDIQQKNKKFKLQPLGDSEDSVNHEKQQRTQIVNALLKEAETIEASIKPELEIKFIGQVFQQDCNEFIAPELQQTKNHNRAGFVSAVKNVAEKEDKFDYLSKDNIQDIRKQLSSDEKLTAIFDTVCVVKKLKTESKLISFFKGLFGGGIPHKQSIQPSRTLFSFFGTKAAAAQKKTSLDANTATQIKPAGK